MFSPHSDTWSPSGSRLSSASYSRMYHKLLAKQVPPAREDRAGAHCSCLFVIWQTQAQAPLALEISHLDFVVMVNQPIFGCLVTICMPWVLLSTSACSLYIIVYVFSIGGGYIFLSPWKLCCMFCVCKWTTAQAEVRGQLLGVGSSLPMWFCEPWRWDSSHQAVVASAVTY